MKPTEKKEEKKAIPILMILGLGGLAAWLLRRRIKPGTAVLYGSVTDIETNLGIPNIQIHCDGYTTRTNANGEYEIINIPPGTYSVSFTDPTGQYEGVTI